MTEENIYSIFDEGGLLCEKLDNFEFREGQLRMAEDVLKTYQDNGIFKEKSSNTFTSSSVP